MRNTSLNLLARLDIPVAAVLTEWSAVNAPKHHATVPDIHASMLLQARALPLGQHAFLGLHIVKLQWFDQVVHRNQPGADVEEEEEEGAERLQETQC